MAALKYWVWFTTLPGLTNRSKLLLLEHFPSPEDIYYAQPEDLPPVEGLSSSQAALLSDKSTDRAEDVLTHCAKGDIFLLTMQDALYPDRLRNIYDPPVLLYEQCGKGCLPLWEALTEQGAQAVICVHVFPAMMMTELSGRGLYLPSYFVATDYTCSPGVSELVVDGICIPHPLLAEEFAAAGLPADRLYPTGIPVSPEFAPAADREAVRVKLHMVGRSHVLVLACGSMGAGPLRGAAEVIRQQLGEDDLLVVVCGSNRRLYRQCRTAFMDDPRVRVLGYTKRMAQFLQAADLLITKAGGLTTTEAVAAGVPIFYLDAIPGCESRNIDFMTRHGYALAIRAEEELPALLQGCLSGALDPTAMVRRRSETFPRHAAANIVKLLSE